LAYDAAVPEGKSSGRAQVSVSEARLRPWLTPWAHANFSRHARERMRLHGISGMDVQGAAEFPNRVERDEAGDWLVYGVALSGRPIVVVFSCRVPDLVIAAFPEGYAQEFEC
jgi:hypothetical protein